jgi:hypothetical protein
MHLYLIVASGKQTGKPLRIDTELFMIGAGPMCQLRSNLPGMGVQQCLITQRERRVHVRDLDGHGTTMVNGDPLPPGGEVPLHGGDRLRAGPLEFLVQFAEALLSRRDVEEWALKCLDRNEEGRALSEDLVLMQRHERAINASKAAEVVIDRLAAERGLVIGRLRIGVEQGVAVVRINDMELLDESELELIEREIHKTLSLPGLHVLFDFKNVRRCSSRVVEMMGNLADWLEKWGSVLAVCRMHPELKELLWAMPSMGKVRIFADKGTALVSDW